MSTGLTFLTPPPGLAPEVRFDLAEVEGAAGLFAMTSAAGADGGTHRLYVLDASVYLPDYHPEITDEQRLQLNLVTSEDAAVLVVANPTLEGTTVNLLAPIVVNVTTGSCAQVILEGQDWPVRAPLEPVAA
ncbi:MULTISPECIES: flagellar assembly protein FliW [unclassified Arthrobacter]|uniref:flagellar assembly protein FliW n=1 Tax=unclassified Arthrobacter TaxID=235627 RepID=UPI001E3C3580|nr:MULTISPECIES: flagellar assembly protein FliW [unclassified Arthrobacter]MCC9146688.1 flagellar assembly protein FliW [Arthrobacter sp. zg-Y919]MDK1277918.1 flagellar assembly protein FliW [Arthrobacter sp. zg.Y919]MDM7991673.1 flagellar assembly protein FliW [Arthrobacter sp. zg-Y877]WIB03488.1 flagellar assembly protein FliW [Arthrobacter sp. zg-Y919]